MADVDTGLAGKQLRALREARGWSRVRLAKLADISESSVRQIEAGERHDGLPFNPRPFTLRQVSFAFGLPDGPDLLREFGLTDIADQLERELMGMDEAEARVGSPRKREIIRQIHSLTVELALED